MRMCQNPPFITQSKQICGEHLIDPLYVTGEQEKYAYIRISTSKQKLDRQINNIRQHYNIPPDNFICEIYTGTEMNRPEWKKLREKLKSGDTVIFDSVSRMSRNADEGIADYMDLYNKGIELIFINEPHINTAKYREATNQAKQNPVRIDVSTGDKKIDELLSFMQDWVNDFMLHIISRDIRAEFEKAENEIADLSRRTKEGMRAKGAGNKISDARTGKKYRTAESMRNRITILERSAKFGGILTESDLAKIIGISRRTVSRYSAEMAEELSTITKDELLAKLKKEVQSKHKS